MKLKKTKRLHTVESYASCVCAWATCSCSCRCVCACKDPDQPLVSDNVSGQETAYNYNKTETSMSNTSYQNLYL